MNFHELTELRRSKWRLDGGPIRTLEDARQFMQSVGFCTMYPLNPPVLAPTFIGAWVGGDADLPPAKHAYADERAVQATELMVRMLRDRIAYEAALFSETNFLVAASVFPYFYALVGDRTPEKTGPGDKLSTLARDLFLVVQRAGPVPKAKLRAELGGGLSDPALDRVLHDLWSRLRITRVDYNPRQGAFWDVLLRWSPEVVREGTQLSVAEALSALVSKYLDCVVAAEPQEVENFLGRIVARSKVREALNALLAARELSFVQVGERSMVQVTPPRPGRPPQEPRAAGARVRPGRRS